MKINKIYIKYILSFVLALCASLQCFGIGNDYYAYKRILESNWISIEPFWQLLRFITIRTHSFVFVYFLISFICLNIKFSFFIKSCKKYYKIVIFFYCITFYFLHEYTQLRIAFAIAIFLSKIEYLYEKKIWHYILLCFVCIMVHYSSILLIPLYFYFNIKNKCFFVIMPTVFLIVTIFFQKVFSIQNGFLFLESFFEESKIDSLIKLLISHSGSIEASNNFVLIFTKRYILYYLFLLFCFFIIEKNDFWSYLNFRLLSYVMSGFYLLCNFPSQVLPIRFSEMLIYSFLILLTNTFFKIKEKFIYVLYYTLVVFMLSYTTLSQTCMFIFRK